MWLKNNVSVNLVKIRIKMEYGRITLKTAKIRIGYGYPYHVACLYKNVNA